MTMEPVIPVKSHEAALKSHEAVVEAVVKSHEAVVKSHEAALKSMAQEKQDAVVEASLLRSNIKDLIRDKHASQEKVSLRGCIGERNQYAMQPCTVLADLSLRIFPCGSVSKSCTLCSRQRASLRRWPEWTPPWRQLRVSRLRRWGGPFLESR